jgi:hypothetical protein
VKNKPPDDLDTRLRTDAPRRLIAAKAGRSGRHDTARRIEEIIRQKSRRSRCGDA